MGIILTISTIVGLIRRHIGTADQFLKLAADGVAAFKRDDGTDIPAELVGAEIDEALAKAAAVGDSAAGRIEDRHQGD